MEVSEFLQEAHVMKELHHPNLLKLHGVCTLEEPFYIVTELMKHGSLLEYLQQGEGRHIITHEMIGMLSQISAGERITWRKGVVITLTLEGRLSYLQTTFNCTCM